MPKSKRAKFVSLTKTSKKGRAGKDALYEGVRESVDKFNYIWVFSVENMRNTFLKDIRAQWKQSGRFFFGKNKVMAKALGVTMEEEYRENLRLIAKELTGDVGLLFTSSSPGEVREYFESFRQRDYARGGTKATETVVIPEGPVYRIADELFPHNMETQLRSLGMPTVLKNGQVTLFGEYEICREGETLTSDQAHLLKLFCLQKAEFYVQLKCFYHDGKVEYIN